MNLHLFIPGPVHVSDKTLRAMQRPMIAHRSDEFVALYRGMQPDLQALFGTADPVYLATSSSWGVMEGALRNVCAKKVLCCMGGAFSDKWLDVARRNGKAAAGVQVEWGRAIDPAAVRAELARGGYDALTLIHNETSTGTMNPLAEILAVVREFPEVISVVDAVSSLGGLPFAKDRLGIDLLITGSQKTLALPPGLTLFSASERARRRAATLPDRGYYCDLLEFHANHERGMTPTTPTEALLYALNSKVEDIRAEGLPARFDRHARLNRKVRAWGEARGWRLLPPPEFGSVTLNCFVCPAGLDPAALNRILREKHGCVIDGGYGKLKGRTLRISNMGDETDASIDQLLASLDSALAELGAG